MVSETITGHFFILITEKKELILKFYNISLKLLRISLSRLTYAWARYYNHSFCDAQTWSIVYCNII